MPSENGAETEESEEYLGRRFLSTYDPDLQNYLMETLEVIMTDSVHKLVSFGTEDFKGSLLVQVIYTRK